MGLFAGKISSRTRERLFREICNVLSGKQNIIPYEGNQKEDFAIGYFSEPIHRLFEFTVPDSKKPDDLIGRLIVCRGEMPMNPTFHKYRNVLAAFFGTDLPDPIREIYTEIANQNNVGFGGYACRHWTGVGPTWAKFYLSVEIDSPKDSEKKVDNFYTAFIEMNSATRGTQIEPDKKQYRNLRLESYHH